MKTATFCIAVGLAGALLIGSTAAILILKSRKAKQNHCDPLCGCTQQPPSENEASSDDLPNEGVENDEM